MYYKTKISHIQESCEIVKLCEDSWGFVSSLLLQNFSANSNLNRDVVFVAKNEMQVELIEKQLKFFAPNLEENFEILHLPAWDSAPFDRASPKQDILAKRVRTLYKIANKNSAKNAAQNNTKSRNFLILTTTNALLQKVVAPNVIKHLGLIVKARSKISIAQISEFLTFNGYQRQSTAMDVGEFAVRGGIVDIVVNKAENLIGYRIDFFGDEVESIKEFDLLSQMSQGLVREIEILPASEVILNEKTCANFRKQYREIFGQNFNFLEDDQLYNAISQNRSYEGMEHWLPLFYEEKLVSFFDYFFAPNSLALFLNYEFFASINEYYKEVLEHYKSRLESVKESRISGTIYNPILPELLYLSDEEITQHIKKNLHVIFNNFENDNNFSSRKIDLEIAPTPDFALAGRTNKKDPLELLKEFLAQNKNKKTLVACLSQSSRERLNKLFLEFNIKAEMCLMPTNQGFITNDFILIGEQTIFGEKINRRKTVDKSASKRILEETLSINIGDLVVHRNHGIGKFDGIHTISLNGANASGSKASSVAEIKTDMLKIIYGGSDVLFVPVEDINLITRYGAQNPLIQLDRLGVAAWKNRKAKIRHRIKVAAQELITIAALRKIRKAPALIANQHLYEEFKARFGFVETNDQLNAIEEVENDLAKGTPMDRLICGDVGFGKTEVAMRAAFIACANNIIDDENFSNQQKFQVAVITPTTLLCRQHFHNFQKRFEGTNLKIAQISRLVTLANQKKTKQDLESGSVDIVIGTHALLNKNIKFKNLALVIIDEEQHFGVAQKERMKELRSEVHLLTLSATPIPRTLQMSLTGVKDLSLIATPPLDRLAVRNFVMPYDSVIVREAIMREYQRHGKVFFVVPRVSDIQSIEDKLHKLVPEVKITHAHGQMTPSQLDEIMNNFYDGKIDVLLSTTIIESGIDVSSANTIIIYKAEMFGLSQLYQLRGRVGRGKTRGYAYFMLSPKKLNKEAKKKLEVMQHLDDLGVGFSIASHDMDIRGSGDLLGDEQSGHIKETGAELYQQMLVEEIERQKNVAKNTGESFSKNSASLQNQASEDILEKDFSVQIKLGISLLIPEEYMPDLALRMSFYKKIANIKSVAEQQQLENEMIDRFGKIPPEILNLMQVSIIKHQCTILGIEKLESAKEGILISFYENKFKAPDKLLQLVFASNSKIKLQGNQKILFVLEQNNKIDAAFVAVEKLTKICQ